MVLLDIEHAAGGDPTPFINNNNIMGYYLDK